MITKTQKKEHLTKESDESKDAENDPIEIVTNVAVKNPFDNLQDNDDSESNKIARVEDEVSDDDSKSLTDSKHFTDHSLSQEGLISSGVNQNEPPDIINVAPVSETKDNIMEMSAEELSEFLNANFRSKQRLLK